MTYSESQGEEPFDWNRAIILAEAGQLSQRKLDAMADKSMDWVTCACGNLCDVIPRDVCGMPRDSQLRELGGRFGGLISVWEWSAARDILKRIEKRSAELIASMSRVEIGRDRGGFLCIVDGFAAWSENIDEAQRLAERNKKLWNKLIA